MSVTRPWTSSPIETMSPIRMGWVIASRRPETRFAITCRPAKPMMMPSTAVEASTPVANRLIEVNWLRARATPIRMIARKSSRRISRRRVRACLDSSLVSPRVVALTARPISRRSTPIATSTATATVSAEVLVDSIRFSAYPDSEPALAALKDRGIRRVAVSNWDCSLPSVLEDCGLGGLMDGVVTSAGAGSRKPEPGIFAAALELAHCAPEEVLHVGDTPEEDVAGARAAGIRALLIDRSGGGGDISSLTEIDQHLGDD